MSGYLDLSWVQTLVVALCMVQLTIFAVTLFLHRAQAHRALTLHPIVSHIFRFWLWMTTGMVTKAWVAIHRKHHAKCETVDDPHSPQVLGIKKVLLEGAELYRQEAENEETLARYGQGTPNDWIERNVYSKYPILGLLCLLPINAFLFGPIGITIWAVQMAWIPIHAAGIINGLAHYIGYRNFETPDAATNLTPWGLWIGGEELHNNHHAYPTSAKFSIRPWEFDIGWMMIRLLGFFGLAKAKRVSPVEAVELANPDLSPQALQDLIYNRFQVMATYSHQVLKPTVKAELKRLKQEGRQALRSQLRKFRHKLLRSNEVLPEWAEIGPHVQQVDIVVRYKAQLQQIWDKTSLNQQELREAVEQWCLKARKSGNEALVQFASYLEGYRLHHA